ncbi:hypothetical protein SPRG_01637 [Saprolegnia parasitica CBS 223.65]|uniref:SPIN90/Ldb17 leucine-rich domain-containing protein n=1 Tax=Saprolegnia parasitica (strain CBS 223.65) TaxID=695850 RepID=A0A067D4Y9_SAPPC|nr:hypothetical protein SPRG_01637 [Saprolegnia parasitica CBS 223.65]KDO33756.1 hypothetical protein SPRG_01637 [Saprolegnia parasitica CBS 223.65]|eukprot:XP_012195394.1 hypothetical protein SPRG_01637 [Saprolegnia parasitica CBS 223.65]
MDALTSALLSMDPMAGHAAMKTLQTTCAFESRDECMAWTGSLLTFAGCGYQFQLLRRLLAATGDDESDASCSDSDSDCDDDPRGRWLRAAITAYADQLVALCTAASTCATTTPGVLFEYLAFLRAAIPLLGASAFEMAASVVSLLPLPQLPQYLCVECIGFLDDVAATIDADDDHDVKATVLVECSLTFLASAFPTLVELVVASSPVVGITFFVGEAKTPGLQRLLLFGLRVLQLGLRMAPTAAMLSALRTLSESAARPESLRRLPALRAKLVEIVSEEDDVLIGAALFALGLYDAHGSSPIAEAFHPVLVFDLVCATIHDDHSVLVDWLTSNETEALAYVVAFLRFLDASPSPAWPATVRVTAITHVLEATCTDLDKYQRHHIIPFNVAPLLRRLRRVLTIIQSTL